MLIKEERIWNFKLMSMFFKGFADLRSYAISRKGKQSQRYIGPFEIMRHVGIVAYEFALPQKLSHVTMCFMCLRCEDICVIPTMCWNMSHYSLIES